MLSQLIRYYSSFLEFEGPFAVFTRVLEPVLSQFYAVHIPISSFLKKDKELNGRKFFFRR
jgi:hypothetical protein